MSDTLSVRTIISPRRYVQGAGAIHSLGKYLTSLGSTPLLVADDVVWGFVGHDIETSLGDAGLPVHREKFNGVPSAAEIDRLVQIIATQGADVIVAIGGGSTIDAVKAAGHLAGINWVTVPTVASTDAPTSALAVVYTENGEFEEYRFFPKNPDLVLVDTQVVANAPAAFLAAGVGDALATWLEARATAAAHAIHNGLTAVPQTHGLAHGQKVNIGSVTQLVLEGAPTSEIREFIEFTTRVGLPNTLTEVGLAPENDQELATIAAAALAPGETIHNMPFEISPTELVAALKSIERFARTVRKEAALPEPQPYHHH